MGGMAGLRPQSEYIGGIASGVFGKEHQMADGEFFRSVSLKGFDAHWVL